MSYKVLLCDLGNTLLRNSKVQFKSGLEVLYKYCNKSMSIDSFMDRVEPRFNQALKDREDTLIEINFIEFLKSLCLFQDEDLYNVEYDFLQSIYTTSLIEESLKILDIANSLHLYIVLMSNTMISLTNIRRQLEEFGILKYFDKIFLSSMVGYCKPDRRFFCYVESLLKQDFLIKDNHDILFIGDSIKNDYNVGIKRGYKTIRIVDTSSYDEVLKLLNCSFQKDYDSFEFLLKRINELRIKPKLLLHCCCGPCSSYVLERLNPYFDITVFFYNPNIYIKEEYELRKAYLIKVIQLINPSISFISYDDDNSSYFDAIKGFEDYPEGSERCFCCYYFRLEKTCKYALENHFDFFSTTLSISPYKNSKVINEELEELSNKYKVAYLYSDFKKDAGYIKSIQFCKANGIYRQDYCGCPYSKAEHEAKIK